MQNAKCEVQGTKSHRLEPLKFERICEIPDFAFSTLH